jgi:hypothetical protein
MEAFTITLKPGDGWRHLGSTPEKSPVEVVLRAFDGDVAFATGATARTADSPPVTVASGGGARLSGLHFFAKVAGPGGPVRILVRGV